MKSIQDRQWVWKIGLLVLLACSYFAVRWRVFHNPLVHEDGIFAELVIHRPASPMNLFNARIDGEKLYGRYFQHPRPSYELLRGVGWLAQKYWVDPMYLNDEVITPRLRIFFSLFELAIWLAVAGIVCFGKSFRGKWPWGLLFAAALCPLGIRSSIYLQIDNTAGVIFCGAAAILFMLVAKNLMPSRLSGFAVFWGAFIAGLGKQEWSLSLLAATAGILLLSMLPKMGFSRKTTSRTVLFLVSGLLLGNLTSYASDPSDYMKGFEVMAKFSKLADTSIGRWDFLNWLRLTTFRAPFLSIYIVLILFFGLSVITEKKQNPVCYLVFLYGVFLLAGYVLSDWSAELRYFAPSLVVLTIACIVAAPVSFLPVQNKVILWGFVCVGVSTVIFYFASAPKKNIYLEQVKGGLLRSTPDTVLFIDGGAVWNKPEINYVLSTINYEGAKRMVKERYGKELIDCTIKTSISDTPKNR